ncbi:NlpC/P60 family protein [Geobacter argillaceus]|uniref:NlpC/P60 domain-containing protein n=1 Tax=Geobacter argillaceus TaxID=345631 RepID=A0A562WQ73_9BACT|nr:peptidoglycan endopeptidase [Geobacter argillaceus]TWJ32459.1 hypothetical protein JN12_00899 [Geobacter argillaceus]
MKYVLLLLLSLLLFARPSSGGELSRFAVAVGPVPVLNTPDPRAVFGGHDGRTLAVDRCGQLRTLEFVALPGTLFTILEELAVPTGAVYRVTSADYSYPSRSGYYIDSRLVHLKETRLPERVRRLPGREEIVARLEGMAGLPYVWGGNIPTGVEALLQLYPPAGHLDQAGRRRWQLSGVDCSGLLYAATDGFTPRNTSSLVGYGSPVVVAGRSVRQIVDCLAPLDLIAWPGHVLVVLDRERIIESRLDCAHPERGVVISPLGERLKVIMATRRPVDRLSADPGTAAREFVVRRWFRVPFPTHLIP